MGQILTANVATSLYWLGRYIERVESTLVHVMQAYDDIIDVQKDAGEKLYKIFHVDIKYDNALDFLHVAILGEHTANLCDISGFARENAIISRNQINKEMFGEIIALNALFLNISKTHIDLDYKLIDSAQSLISEIWGELSKRKYKKYSDYFIRLGKLVEEADFCFRFNEDEDHTNSVLHDIYAILAILSEDTSVQQEQRQSTPKDHTVMNDIYKRIETIIVE